MIPSIRRLRESPTITTWGSIALRTGSALITTPLIVTHLTTAEIAVWYLFSSIIALQPLFELGFTPSFVRAVSYAIGGATDLRTGRPGIDAVIRFNTPDQVLDSLCRSMKRVYSTLAFATVAILAVGGTVALMRSISAIEHRNQAWAGWLVILVGSFFTFRNLTYSAFLQGANKIPDLRRIEMASAMIAVMLNAIVLVSGGGIFLLALSSQASNVAGSEWSRSLARRFRRGAFEGKSNRFDVDVIRAVWPSTWRSGLGILMSFGVVQLSAIAYAQYGTPGQVAALLFSLRILQIILSMSQAPFYSKIPQLARLHAESRTSDQLRMASRGMALAYWVYVSGVIGVGVGMNWLLESIGSNVSFVPIPLWYLIGIAYFVERFGAMHIQLYSVTNHIIWHRANGIAGVLYLLVLWGAFPILGLFAFPTAILAGYLGFYSWYAAIHSYRYYGLRFREFEGTTSLAPAALLLVTAAVSFGLSCRSVGTP